MARYLYDLRNTGHEMLSPNQENLPSDYIYVPVKGVSEGDCAGCKMESLSTLAVQMDLSKPRKSNKPLGLLVVRMHPRPAGCGSLPVDLVYCLLMNCAYNYRRCFN